MKVLLVGDCHFRHQLPYATALEDGRTGEWQAVKQFCIDLADECDEVILMGDVLNSKHNHSSVNSELVTWLHEFGNKPIHMLVGNHERYGHRHALEYIQEMKHPKWHVYDQITKIKLGDKDAVMLPFLTAGVLGEADLSGAQVCLQAELEGHGEADYLFHHHIAEGTVWSQTSETTDLHEVYVPKSLFGQYSKVIGGHIHKRAWVTDDVLVTGNLFTNEVGEHDKAVFILDTETNTVTEHTVPCRGIYKVEAREHPDFSTIPDASIVKVTVLNPELQGEGVARIREECQRFDSYILVEQYPRKRQKMNIEDAGKLDLSLDNLLKVYAKARKVEHTELQQGLELLET